MSKYRDLLIVLPMREPSIFRGNAVSLLRPVIGSNVEIDVVALNWFAYVRKQIATAFKWLYKYFTLSSTVFNESSTFTVIIKLLHHRETPVQMVCLYNTSNIVHQIKRLHNVSKFENISILWLENKSESPLGRWWTKHWPVVHGLPKWTTPKKGKQDENCVAQRLFEEETSE